MNRLLFKLLKFFVRTVARYHRFIDPVDLFARLARFGQPSEVAVPTELLRAGARMHARGLLNSQAIQYNLDWVWPYWVDRQFDPADESFVPRAFSLTHINLTHRNWTCVGAAGETELPIVDPRGLVTPFYDSWSLDVWFLSPEREDLLFSETERIDQEYQPEGIPAVTTQFRDESLELSSRVSVDDSRSGRGTVCRIELECASDVEGWVAVSLRPFNPEGISTVNRLGVKPDLTGWDVRTGESTHEVYFDPLPDRHLFSNFDRGDVYHEFPDPDPGESARCSLGMVTGAACWELASGGDRTVELEVPLEDSPADSPGGTASGWRDLEVDRCVLEVPDDRYTFLFRSSIKTLQLLSGRVIYPGPFTYRRFWYRDAAFMLKALLVTGYDGRVGRVLEYFPEEQTGNGYFCSQKGEWDSNGEALWIMNQYCQYTNTTPPSDWKESIESGARWIRNKRLDPALDEPHAGLLPAGFSAEHFGPNDYYYWDDYWAVAGFEAAGEMLRPFGEDRLADGFCREAVELLERIDHSMEPLLQDGGTRAMPPSPYRSVDAGSIGSLVAGYPLGIYPPDDDRLLDTADRLIEECFHEGVFFQEMIHSGKNPYLSLHIAQVLLRASDRRFRRIVRSVAGMASETGKWPEAVHPATGGGCMGDGEHGWAAAEWVLMMRNMFVRETEDGLILGQGVLPGWLEDSRPLRFGPTLTAFGSVALVIRPSRTPTTVELETDWHDEPPVVTVRLPGHETIEIVEPTTRITVPEASNS